MSFKYKNQEISENNGAYSEEEIEVGTWIDGRPIYRKVILGTSPAAVNSVKNIGTIDTDATILSLTGILEYTQNKQYFPIPYITTKGDHISMSYYNRIVSMFTSDSGLLNKPVMIYVEYVK